MSVLYALYKAYTVAAKTLVKEVNQLSAIVGGKMSAMMILYFAILKTDDVAAQCKVVWFHFVTYRGCLQWTSTLVHLIHIIAKDSSIGNLATRQKTIRHCKQASGTSNTCQMVHIRSIGIFEKCFSSKTVDGMVGHTVAKYYNVFHTQKTFIR